MSAFVFIPALIIIACYSILITVFFAGWLRTKSYKPDTSPPVTRISVLVPCRNEEENIDELFRELNSQDYPDHLTQIIWIDDHSTDRTAEKIQQLIGTIGNNALLRLPDSLTGKKSALKAGMEIASGELILLTDADSRHTPRWIFTLAKFFEDSGSDLILGPVVISPAKTVFEQIQKLEYLSLVASSVGSAGIGRPIMAQGPNIAVRASDYRSVVDDLDKRFVSGDDVFLLQAMKAVTAKKIGYVLNTDAIVSSKPAVTPAGFFRQRQRWASKASGYRDPIMIITTILVFLTNLLILGSLMAAASGSMPYTLFFILLGVKTAVDLPLMLAAMKFFNCMKLLVWYIPMQLIYPVYITFTGILSQINPVRWK